MNVWEHLLDTHTVNCLEISFDKSNLYSGGNDKTLRVWDISSGDCLKTINLNDHISCFKLLSSDLLAVGLHDVQENLKIIDLNSQKILKSFEALPKVSHL